MIKYNTSLGICQEILHDKPNNGRRERPWARYKHTADYYAMAYDDVDSRKAERIRSCGSWLDFVVGGDCQMTLHNANFCRVRLCPMCAWRRSLKCYAQVRSIMADFGARYSYIFLTLTVPNCKPDDLADTITRLCIGFNRLVKYKRVSSAIRGYYKAVEVSHNVDVNSPSYNTYHPHIHCIFAVEPYYFSSRNYIKHDDWLAMWRRAMQDDSIMQVDVRRVKGAEEHAVAEVSKYAVKPNEIIVDDWSLTVETVRVLDKALSHRRFVGFGGCFAEAHKRLHLDDVEDGDLTHIEADITSVSDDELQHVVYAWHSGYNQYVLRHD